MSSLQSFAASSSYSGNSSPYGFTCMDRISNEGFRQYWDELEQRVDLPMRLQDLIKGINQANPEALYSERFKALTVQLREQCGIPIPNGVYLVAKTNFQWMVPLMNKQDKSLMEFWDEIEPEIPNGRKAAFLISDTLEVKAQKIRAWFQDPQFDKERLSLKCFDLSSQNLLSLGISKAEEDFYFIADNSTTDTLPEANKSSNCILM